MFAPNNLGDKQDPVWGELMAHSPSFLFLTWTLQSQQLFKAVFSSENIWSEGVICIILLKRLYLSIENYLRKMWFEGKGSLIFCSRRWLMELSLLCEECVVSTKHWNIETWRALLMCLWVSSDLKLKRETDFLLLALFCKLKSRSPIPATGNTGVLLWILKWKTLAPFSGGEFILLSSQT